MVRRAESLIKNQRLLLKKEGWSKKKFLQERKASVDFTNPLDEELVRFVVSIIDFSA